MTSTLPYCYFYYDTFGFPFKDAVFIDYDANGIVDEYVDVIRESFPDKDIELKSCYNASHDLICASRKTLFGKFIINLIIPSSPLAYSLIIKTSLTLTFPFILYLLRFYEPREVNKIIDFIKLKILKSKFYRKK